MNFIMYLITEITLMSYYIDFFVFTDKYILMYMQVWIAHKKNAELDLLKNKVGV